MLSADAGITTALHAFSTCSQHYSTTCFQQMQPASVLIMHFLRFGALCRILAGRQMGMTKVAKSKLPHSSSMMGAQPHTGIRRQ